MLSVNQQRNQTSATELNAPFENFVSTFSFRFCFYQITKFLWRQSTCSTEKLSKTHKKRQFEIPDQKHYRGTGCARLVSSLRKHDQASRGGNGWVKSGARGSWGMSHFLRSLLTSVPLLGLQFPKVPLNRLPFLVFLSPLPHKEGIPDSTDLAS